MISKKIFLKLLTIKQIKPYKDRHCKDFVYKIDFVMTEESTYREEQERNLLMIKKKPIIDSPIITKDSKWKKPVFEQMKLQVKVIKEDEKIIKKRQEVLDLIEEKDREALNKKKREVFKKDNEKDLEKLSSEVKQKNVYIDADGKLHKMTKAESFKEKLLFATNKIISHTEVSARVDEKGEDKHKKKMSNLRNAVQVDN